MQILRLIGSTGTGMYLHMCSSRGITLCYIRDNMDSLRMYIWDNFHQHRSSERGQLFKCLSTVVHTYGQWDHRTNRESRLILTYDKVTITRGFEQGAC
jgi:hypothetical protein